MFSVRVYRCMLAVGAAVPLAISQGQGTFLNWGSAHYPAGGEFGTVDSQIEEHDQTVIPPNPPWTWSPTIIPTTLVLDTQEGVPRYFPTGYGPMVYYAHDVHYNPGSANASGLLQARYPNADTIYMWSHHPVTHALYETWNFARPADWH